MHTLKLVIPGLFEPLRNGTVKPDAHFPQTPGLCHLLSRAKPSRFGRAEYHDTLFRLFDLGTSKGKPHPVAALSYLAEVGDPGFDWVLRIDPVHLQADRDRLVLLDNYALELSDDEASECIKSLNTTYDDMEWSVEMGVPSRWYLRLRNDPDIQTRSLDDVVGKNIDPFLPAGKEKQHWQSIMNEMQMLLHSHSVNQLRANSGKLPVNSVWLWGEGSLSALEQLENAATIEAVCASNPLAHGIASYLNINASSLPEEIGKWIHDSGDRAALVVLDDLQAYLNYGELDKWVHFLAEIEHQWVTPVLSALNSGSLHRLELYDASGHCYTVTGKLLKRWWKRTLPLDRCI